MKITIINTERKEKRYTRVELEEFVSQLRDGFYIVRIASPDGSAHATKLIVKH